MINRCWVCDKLSYPTRSLARQALRHLRRVDHPEAPVMSSYRCPQDQTVWHVGHDMIRQRRIDNERRQLGA